jgi:hypothetical protein
MQENLSHGISWEGLSGEVEAFPDLKKIEKFGLVLIKANTQHFCPSNCFKHGTILTIIE